MTHLRQVQQTLLGIAVKEQFKRECTVIFWCMIVGMIVGSLFAVSYVMYH